MTGPICNNVLMGMLLLQRTIVPPTGAAVHERRLDETMRVWESDGWSSGLCATSHSDKMRSTLGTRAACTPDRPKMFDQRSCSAMFAIKRIYDPALPEGGYRVLVDRIWPRGMSKEDAAVDRWMKGIAPSAGLREWFGHDPAKFAEFRGRHLVELARSRAPPGASRARARTPHSHPPREDRDRNS